MAIMKFKKAVLASVVSSVMFAAAANAEVNLVIGGDIDFQASFRNEDLKEIVIGKIVEGADDNNGYIEKRNNNLFTNEAILELKVLGHTDAFANGLNYGAKLVIEAATSSSKYHLPQINVFTTPYTVTVGNAEIARSRDISGLELVNGRAFAYNPNRNAREAMIFAEGTFGRVEAGNTYGATKKMKVDAGTVAAGSGGVYSDALLYTNPFVLYGNFRTPDLLTNSTAFYNLDGLFLPALANKAESDSKSALPYSTELATAGKLSYYSPNFNGFQVGLTYIPDTDSHGTAANVATVTKRSSQHGLGFKDVVEGGFNYTGSFSDFDFKFSVLAQHGKAKANSNKLFVNSRLTPVPHSNIEEKLKNLKGYEFGLATQFMGVGFAGSYGRNDGLLNTLQANKYYTLGVGYETGPLGFSVNYMNNSQGSRAFVDAAGEAVIRKAKFDSLVFDVAYTCQGFMPYLSVAKFKAERPENGGTKIKNKGTILLLGTKISF